MPERWTFKATARRYQFLLDGRPQDSGGPGDNGPPMSSETARRQAVAHTEFCRKECRRRNLALAQADNNGGRKDG